MVKRRQTIVLIIVLGLLTARLWSLRFTSKDMASSSAPVKATQAQTEDKSAPDAAPAGRELVPDDPAKYGMVVVPESTEPQSAEEWEKYIRSGIEQNKVLDTPQAKSNLAQAAIKREDFEKHMAKVDADIDKIEKELQEKPFDMELKRRLKTLYQLKAVDKVIEEKVIVQ